MSEPAAAPRRRVAAVAATAVLTAAVGIGALVVESWDGEGSAPRASVAVPTPAPAVVEVVEADPVPVVPDVRGFVAAEAVVPTVVARTRPDDTAPEVATLENPTWEGFPLTFVVLEERGEWSHVRLLMRPNGSTGWVRTAELRTFEVANRIVVELGARRLTVLRGDGDEILYQTDVGVGTGRTPTPVGEFWIDIVNPLTGNGPYGWGQLSVSGFSDVHQTFAGGIGQIAIHGTNRPDQVGGDVSNGCIRMRNDDIAHMATLVGVGTPVTILA